ncbi:ATP-binding SpoIIE family protein phosphatase [Janthinobacterium sp. AD80]|uniref:ATP-binding SpoIIE family protein phosphatase n=1 Tax=Janthinobacterium sp. AD80 TaxID=1528773 RepID=UPI000C847F91|nr:ATP-binding SpoIIE family protein phosphatase [Janthinobacterium sp. AD80]PMQ14896.1 Anti-sigma regulatory factor [Janthinobacterium sp. AD80]
METVLNHLEPQPDILRQRSFSIGEPSEIAAARRAGNELARLVGFDDVRAGQLAIVISEAATNIIKHARRGEILLRKVLRGGTSGIEVLAIDQGPGMGNVRQHMQDGQSTTGTYGVGLGAIRRLSQEFDLYTAPGKGAALMMVVWGPHASSSIPASPNWQIGAVCLPLASEQVCGDAWNIVCEGHELSLMVADGLGHGPLAARASETASALLENSTPGLPPLPAPFIELAHGALRGTRGAAMAVAHIDSARRELRYAGVGNIAACAFDAHQRRHLLSHNGIVGSNLRKVQEFRYPWQLGTMLVMHTDGLHTRWDLEQYPGLAQCHPSLVAAVLYRDFARGRDDITVVVLREHEEHEAVTGQETA